jgi:hypothetical protein
VRLKTEWAGPRTLTIPVDASIDRLRVGPDTKPCVFKVTGLVAVTPP